jgi:formyl-CoA transferase
MMALFDRSRTGVGRWVHTSLLESLIFMLDLQGSRYLVKGEVAKQAGNDHPTLTPTGVFPTSDGYMNIAASSGRLWERLCDVLGHPEWKTKEGWNTVAGRTKVRAEVNGAIGAVTKTQTGEYWTEKFDAAGIPAGPINTIDRVFNDPQVKHVGMAAPVDSPLFGKTHYVANPLNMTGSTRDIRMCAPEPGQHNDEVLEWLGMSKEEIAALRDGKII